MKIIEICAYSDFESIYSEGILFSENIDIDLNKINKEFIKSIEEDRAENFVILEENEYSLKIANEEYLTKELKEYIIYFKDDCICYQGASFDFSTEKYKEYLLENGFKSMKSIPVSINSEL